MRAYEYSFVIKRPDGNVQIVPVEFKRAALSKSIRITPNIAKQVVRVTFPIYASRTSAILFLEAKRDWVIKQLEAMPKKLVIKDGAKIPFMGERYKIIGTPQSRRGVWLEDGYMFVSGEPEFLVRRVKDFIKAAARREFAKMAAKYAKKLGKKPAKISVKDTTSRWGSCSADGSIVYSWRLAFAPVWVAEYIVAHEVTHLAHMNHSARFWKRLGEVYQGDVDAAIKWLARNGPSLHLID